MRLRLAPLSRMISVRETREKQQRDKGNPPPELKILTQKELEFKRQLASIRLAIENKNIALSLKLMPELPLVPTEILHSISMLKYNEPEILPKMEAILKQLTLRKSVSAASFETLMHGYLLSNNGRAMEELLQFMVNKQVVISDKIILMMLRHYAKEGSTVQCDKLLKFFLQTQVPSPEYFLLWIDACGNAKKPWESMSVLREMENHGLEISIKALERVLQAFSKNGDVNGIMNTQNIIISKGFKLDSLMYNSIINGYKHAGKFEKALGVYLEMKEKAETDDSVAPNAYTFSILIDMYAKTNDAENANLLLEDMTAKRIPLEHIYFHSVMTAFRNAGKPEMVKETFDKMVSYGLEPNQDTFSILISLYGLQNNLAQVHQVCETMKYNRILPSKATIGLLIRTFADGGEYETAHKWYGELKNRGMYPNAKIISSMIRLTLLEKKSIENVQFYVDLSCSLNLICTQHVRELCLAYILDGSSLITVLQLYMNLIEKHSLKVDRKSIYLFVDAVLRRPFMYESHLRRIVTSSKHEPTIVKGKSEFLSLVDRATKDGVQIPGSLKTEIAKAQAYLT